MSWNYLNAPNLGLLVYKRLYTEQSIKEKIKYDSDNQKLVINISKEAKDTPFDDFYKSVFDKRLTGYTQIENPATNSKFTLFTTYPGLLAGTGYTHDSNAKGDIKIGFFFDHTTGQPIIPGSSIKGVLKSIFEDDNDITTQSALDAWRFIINEIIDGAKDDKKQGWQRVLAHFENNESGIKLLKDLKLNIFGTQDKEGDDVFFDAVINIEKSGTSNKFMASDFITPHQPNLLKNPTPLMFLKVLPNIAFEFRFALTEYKDQSLNISAKQKEEIFQKILLTLGIGAKTNVGYGQFSSHPIKIEVNETPQQAVRKEQPHHQGGNFKRIQPEKFEHKSKYERMAEQAVVQNQSKVNLNTANYPEANESMMNGIDATIVEVKSGTILVKPHYRDSENINIQGKTDKKKGDVIKIKPTDKSGKAEKGNLKFIKASLVK